MKKLYTGKTKDVYKLEDGNIMLLFKDDMTGADGEFDPGANQVGLTIKGAGQAGLAMSAYYFKLLEKKGYNTHFISVEKSGMIVKPATSFKGGLEIICRYKALGSFVRRYGGIISEGAPLDAVVEMTVKDDERGDPLINDDALEAIGILEPGQYNELKTLMKKISHVIKEDLAEKNLELSDIKLEFGMDKDGKIMLIDEISGGNMRVFENGTAIPPLELSRKVIPLCGGVARSDGVVK